MKDKEGCLNPKEESKEEEINFFDEKPIISKP